MADTSARLELPLIQAAQAQKHVTHNEALSRLDLLVQLVVEDFDAQTPPSNPDAGEIWALSASPADAWVGQSGALAAYLNNAWVFITPQEGWRAYGLADAKLRHWTGAAWVEALPDLDNLSGIGINTTSDTTNRLAVASEATLLSHDGAGHQLKLNKASLNDTASLLYQNGFSGRAEMGLAGSDGFSVKVSADGETWHTSLLTDPATGAATLPNGVQIDGALTGTAITQSATDATTGRVLKVGDSATMLSASPALRMVLGGTADALNVTTRAGISGVPPVGFEIRFRAEISNSGPATLALDGGTAIECRTVSGEVLPAEYIRVDADTSARFEGTHWVLSREIQRRKFGTDTVVQWADGTIQCQMTRNIDVSTLDSQEFSMPVAFAATGASAAGTVALSYLTTGPHFFLRNKNIKGMIVTTSHVALKLISTGTSNDPNSDAEQVIFTATGSWY